MTRKAKDNVIKPQSTAQSSVLPRWLGDPDKGHLPISMPGSAAVRQEGMGHAGRPSGLTAGSPGPCPQPAPLPGRQASPRDCRAASVSSLCDYEGTKCGPEEREMRLQCFESDCHSIKYKYIFNQMMVFQKASSSSLFGDQNLRSPKLADVNSINPSKQTIAQLPYTWSLANKTGGS